MSDEVEPFSAEDDLDEGDTATTPTEDNKSFRQLRDTVSRYEKQLKSKDKELERLTAFEAEVLGERTETAINSVFTEVGLNPKHAELFKRVNTELAAEAVTADAVRAFAAEFELATSTGEVPEAPAPESVGFTPITTGTGSPGGMLTADDIAEKLRNGDLDGVARAIQNGRVNKEVPWRS